MKAMLREVLDGNKHYQALIFVCPGCKSFGLETGLHMLPVNTSEKLPSWAFDGNVETPTLYPSILTTIGEGRKCHSFLRNGVFEYLNDCDHEYAGKMIPMVDLPHWITES